MIVWCPHNVIYSIWALLKLLKGLLPENVLANIIYAQQSIISWQQRKHITVECKKYIKLVQFLDRSLNIIYTYSIKKMLYMIMFPYIFICRIWKWRAQKKAVATLLDNTGNNHTEKQVQLWTRKWDLPKQVQNNQNNEYMQWIEWT